MPGETLSFDIFANDRASATFKRLGLAAENASGDVRTLGDRLDKLGSRVTTARVKLDGNKEAGVELDQLDVKLIRLGKKVANPNITVEGKVRALADIAAVDLAMDKLNRKFTGPSLRRSLLSRLGGAGTPGILGGGSAAAGGAGLGVAALGPWGIGALVAAAAALGPALIPTALGIGVGGIGAAGGIAVGAKDRAKLLALQKSLAGVTGTTASSQARRGVLQAQIAAFQQSHGPQLAFGQVGAGVLAAAQGTFFGALTQRPVLAPGGTGPGTHGQVRGQSFLQGLIPIFEQIERFIKRIGPSLGDLFRASVPYLGMFVHFLEQAAKTLLPVFTQMLKQMSPFLPLIGAGLMHIVDGFAGFLKAIGPQGMQASAKIFVALTIVMEYALKGLGIAINWLVENIPVWVHDIAKWWDWLATGDKFRRHKIAVIFDGIRHDIAHTWDQIFQNSIGMVIRLVHNIETQYNSLRHGLASTFDTIRHGIASAWDTIWNNTVARVRRGIADVVGFFKALPGRVINALQGLGTSLYNFGHMALTKLWNGLKAVFGDVWNWFKSLPGKLLHAIGIASPPDWAIAAGKHIMGGILHGITSRKTELQGAFRSSVALGGDALANQALARRIFPWGASQWAPFVNLVMAESGFDRFARNSSSGAYGIAQALPPTKYPFAGQAAGGSHAGPQLSWMFNYIAQRYGTPAGAWAHELSAHWYGSGLSGGVFRSPTLIGVGERGPEMVSVTPLRGAGQRVVFEFAPGSDGMLATALLQVLRKAVRTYGGGDVQAALGRG